MSVLKVLYILFLFAYFTLMAMAFYRVWVFSEMKILGGKSRHISFATLLLSVVVVIFTLVIMSMYTWNDTFSVWYHSIVKSNGSQVGQTVESKKLPIQSNGAESGGSSGINFSIWEMIWGKK